ncbi:MAG TPA: N-succinylarginine dihydrolase, partial [Phenylobacterium sp.]|nr:N-succinylarginine dihydrolase [Phenylobacterium sp.]
AFADPARLYSALRERLPNLHVVETFGVSLADAVSSYLFNSQLVTLPDGNMALILPSDAKDSAPAWKAVQAVLAADNPITQAVVVDVRESMRNGGGPACLRLRVPVDGPARAGIDPRFLLTPERWEALAKVVEAYWPEAIAPDDLLAPELWAQGRAAHAALETVISR